jgi:hypothetical protein
MVFCGSGSIGELVAMGAGVDGCGAEGSGGATVGGLQRDCGENGAFSGLGSYCGGSGACAVSGASSFCAVGFGAACRLFSLSGVRTGRCRFCPGLFFAADEGTRRDAIAARGCRPL